jgi:hypothetical protein
MSNHEAINNVRRKINEVMKKTDEQIVVGWRPGMEPTRQEGDVWTGLDDRKWTIKNGIKQTVTKLDSAKNPWFCPQCNKALSHKLDSKFWALRGKCMDCVIVEETEIRRQGKWEEYERNKLQSNYLASLKDTIAQLEDAYENLSAPEVILADDTKILMIEKWDVDINKVKADLQKDIDELKAHLSQLQPEIVNETS